MQELTRISPPDLSGRVAAVTGSAQGIGYSVAKQLVEAGAAVFAGMRAPGEARIEGAESLSMDVTDETQIESAFRYIGLNAGRLDILVNNAGTIVPICHFRDTDVKEFGRAIDVNVLGPARCIRAAIPLMQAQTGGVIVNAGTGAAKIPLEGRTAYCCSKSAALMLSRMVDEGFKCNGIRVFDLGIPPTDTRLQELIRASGINRISKIPRESLLDPDIPASAAVWLCGEEALKIDEVVLDLRDDLFRRPMTDISKPES
ncbi:MAG: SDR family NAD(P)-dependent oxidoreductase [Albidovulum sp.]|nr:SDR family NAD(P)-dependent oxidoreductase [Albidovulum sp.]